MAAIEANKTIVVMGRETTYGAVFTTPTVKIPDMMDYTFGKEQIAVPQKTQTLEPKIKTSQLGRLSPTVTLTGILTASHLELLVACFGDTSSPYVIGTSDLAANAAGYSYTIVQAVPASSSDLGDGVVATGCRLETLNISKNGQYIGYTATFRAKTIDDRVDLGSYTLSSITNTTYPELTPFLFKSVTASLCDTAAVTKLNTFSLDITNEFADDDIIFQNTSTKVIDPKCGTTATLSAEFIYDTVKDASVYDNLLSQTTQTDVITLTGPATWAITTEGQYQDYSKPDKEKCLYTSSFTKALLGDGSNTAISIAVS